MTNVNDDEQRSANLAQRIEAAGERIVDAIQRFEDALDNATAIDVEVIETEANAARDEVFAAADEAREAHKHGSNAAAEAIQRARPTDARKTSTTTVFRSRNRRIVLTCGVILLGALFLVVRSADRRRSK